MNVTPRERTRQKGDLWRVDCGICSHIFLADLALKPRMIARCPNCDSYNVWNEEVAAPPADNAAG